MSASNPNTARIETIINKKRVTVTVLADVSKSVTAFRVARSFDDPLPRDVIRQITEQIGCGKLTVYLAFKLKRLFEQHPDAERQLLDGVLHGKISVQSALTILKEVYGAKPPRRPEPRPVPKAPIYGQVCELPEKPSRAAVEKLASWLGVSASTVRDAMTLRKVLSHHPELRREWAGKAVTGCLSPRGILNKIKAAQKKAPTPKH